MLSQSLMLTLVDICFLIDVKDSQEVLPSCFVTRVIESLISCCLSCYRSVLTELESSTSVFADCWNRLLKLFRYWQLSLILVQLLFVSELLKSSHFNVVYFLTVGSTRSCLSCYGSVLTELESSTSVFADCWNRLLKLFRYFQLSLILVQLLFVSELLKRNTV